MSAEEPNRVVASGDRNILIYLSEQATLRAQREGGEFVILVPAELASRLMSVGMDRRAAWVTRRASRTPRVAA